MKNNVEMVTDNGVLIDTVLETRGDDSFRWNALTINICQLTDSGFTSKLDIHNISSKDLEKLARTFQSLAKTAKRIEAKIFNMQKLQIELE